MIWPSSKNITTDDVRSAIAPTLVQKDSELLNRSLGEGFTLQETISLVASHYLQRALDQAHGNKTKAANLVGLPSYQTLIKWLKRHELES
jgi:transcriptional regulator with PAS, ATPase and Fis domain